MILQEVKNTVLNSPEYSFIWDGRYTPVLISLGGSWAYGTNKETSDVDVRGIVLDPKPYKLLEEIKIDVLRQWFKEQLI